MTDDAEYITPFCEGDEEEINSMYNEVFGFDRSLDEWRWKFRDHPFPELTMISKLVQKGKIIGHIGSLPGRFKIADQFLFGGQIVDYVIHPAYQFGKRSTHINQELNTSMKNGFVDRGIAFGYGFPNALSYPIAMKYLKGAEDVMDIPIWKKWLRPPPLPTASGEGGGTGLFRNLAARCTWHLREIARTRSADPNPDFDLIQLTTPDARLDALWKASSRQIENMGVRDLTYLNWRFFDKPGKTYAFWLLEQNGVPMAYAVTSVKARTVRTGYIVDCLFRPGKGVLESLLNRLMQRMAEQKIDVIKCLAIADSPLAGSLERLGFGREPQGVKMIAWILTPSIERSRFFDSGRWHITYADLDGT